MGTWQIRKINKKDNLAIAQVIRAVLLEFDVPQQGTAFADASLDCMFETYQAPQKTYYVVEAFGTVIGGAGISPLAHSEGKVSELQKMYFLPQARGRGIGSQLIDVCLEKAKRFDFKYCYLETLPTMEAAQKRYLQKGFQYLKAPLGATGHYSCNVWMIKKL